MIAIAQEEELACANLLRRVEGSSSSPAISDASEDYARGSIVVTAGVGGARAVQLLQTTTLARSCLRTCLMLVTAGSPSSTVRKSSDEREFEDTEALQDARIDFDPKLGRRDWQKAVRATLECSLKSQFTDFFV